MYHPFVQTLSYSKAVSRPLLNTEDEIHIFRGSSLNRKHEKAKHQATKEKEASDSEKDAKKNILPQNARLHTNEADQYADQGGGLDPAEPQRNTLLMPIERKLSSRSKSKIREKIYALYAASQSTDFTFLTLTVIGECTDRGAQTCLNKLLTVMRKRYGRFMYLWVVERQANGRIHFHVILNRRFPVIYLNALWVYQQCNAGIRNEAADNKIRLEQGTTIEYLYLAGRYKEINQYLNPLDIKRVRDINTLGSYVTKYITKNAEAFTCLCWHCCRGVSALFTSQIIGFEEFKETTNPQLNSFKDRKTGETISAIPFEIKDKKRGGTVAVVTTIYNRKHFKKTLRHMNALNELIVNAFIKKDDYRETFVLSHQDYLNTYMVNIDLN